MYKKISILVVAFCLSACSTIPEELQLPAETNLVTYQAAASQFEQSVGQQVRWGGVIAKIENQPDATMLEVVHYPLRRYGKPLAGDESIGRFRVYVNGFMDPLVYQEGRSMTFTGELSGLEDDVVGEQRYVFPTIQSSAYYIWKDVQRVDVIGINTWPYGMWNRGFPGGFHGGFYGGFNQRVLIRNSDSRSHGKAGVSNKARPVSRPATQEK